MNEINTDNKKYKYSVGDCFVNSFGSFITISEIVDDEAPYKCKRHQEENSETIYYGEKYLDDTRKL